MATVYKVEMEIVSDFMSYSEKDLSDIIYGMIEYRNIINERGKGSTLRISDDKFIVRKIR